MIDGKVSFWTFTGATGPTGPTPASAKAGPEGPPNQVTFGTAGVLVTTLTGNTFTTMTGDTGVSTSRPLWYAGLVPNASALGGPALTAEVGFSSTYGSTWVAYVTATSSVTLSNAGYTLHYYTE